MKNKESNKIMATATVVIALNAAVQTMLYFKEFSSKVESPYDIIPLVIIGFITVLAVYLGFTSWQYLSQK